METKKECPKCGKLITGRSDKQYCSSKCRSAHYNIIIKVTNNSVMLIDKILHKNHHILTVLMGEQRKKMMIDRLELEAMGFNFKYYTSTYLNHQQKLYYYIYDFAYMEFSTQEVLIVKKN